MSRHRCLFFLLVSVSKVSFVVCWIFLYLRSHHPIHRDSSQGCPRTKLSFSFFFGEFAFLFLSFSSTVVFLCLNSYMRVLSLFVLPFIIVPSSFPLCLYPSPFPSYFFLSFFVHRFLGIRNFVVILYFNSKTVPSYPHHKLFES